MRILITGGAGFIGSHLSDYLLVRGHYVTVIDDLSTGSMENIREAKENRRFQYCIDTIFDKPLLAELIDDAEIVFHLAAAVGVLNIVDAASARAASAVRAIRPTTLCMRNSHNLFTRVARFRRNCASSILVAECGTAANMRVPEVFGRTTLI